jgi:signal transduction histidine kinase
LINVVRADEPAVRILIVEDDPQVRRLLELSLGRRWEIEVAEDGEVAWPLALRSHHDLILSDVRMPRMGGIDLLRRLRADPRTQDIPVILISGAAGERETIAGLEAGADDFLVKPFSTRELLVRVQTRLEVTAMRRRNAQQEEALASLQRHTDWTERLLDLLPLPLFLLEPGTARILFANRAATRMAEAPLSRGANLANLGPLRRPDDEGGGPLDVRELAPDSPHASTPLRRLVWSPGPEPIWLLAGSEILPGMNDGTPVVLLTLQDVTSLVLKETELRHTLRVRDEFLSEASHELRTPITTLRLQADGLLGTRAAVPNAPNGPTVPTLPLDEKLQRRLVSIRNQVIRLEQLVDALLDVSRLVEGRLELHPEPIDLYKVTCDAVDLLRDAATRAGSQVHLQGHPGVTGQWDRLRVGQVVTNLLSNAIKFGLGQPIDVAVDASDGEASVSVRDRGVGVSPEERARIFERFERAASERHYPGLGLGLWITKQIVDACRGNISVDSCRGEGTTFTVELPRE